MPPRPVAEESMRPLSTMRVPVKAGRNGVAAEVLGPQLAVPLTGCAEFRRMVPGPVILFPQPPVTAGAAVA